MSTAEETPLDLQIVLELIRYLRLRHERLIGGTLDASLTLEIVKNLPHGVVNIGSVLHQSTHIQEAIMGDQYEVGQAGAVGPQSIAIGQHFQQVWNKASAEIDLQTLAQELSQIRDACRGAASGTVDEDVAVAELGQAQRAAEQNDGPKALSHLARAGKWVLAIAQQIGVPVAIKALESAMGS